MNLSKEEIGAEMIAALAQIIEGSATLGRFENELDSLVESLAEQQSNEWRDDAFAAINIVDAKAVYSILDIDGYDSNTKAADDLFSGYFDLVEDEDATEDELADVGTLIAYLRNKADEIETLLKTRNAATEPVSEN